MPSIFFRKVAEYFFANQWYCCEFLPDCGLSVSLLQHFKVLQVLEVLNKITIMKIVPYLMVFYHYY